MKNTILIAIIFTSMALRAQPGALDLSFDPGIGADSSVRKVIQLADGKIIIGGYVRNYNGTPVKRLVKLNTDGSRDTSFTTTTGPNLMVWSILEQPNGMLLVNGQFGTYQGVLKRRLARLYPNGLLDTTFNNGSGFNDYVLKTAILPDGKIIAGGNFTSYEGITQNNLIRLDTLGNQDTTFVVPNGINGSVEYFVVQPDSHILIGGSFTNYGGMICLRVARTRPNGDVDSTFNTGIGGAGANVDAIALQPDGKIILAGEFTYYNGTPEQHIVRTNSNGSIDFTFSQNYGANMPITSLHLLPNANILAVGEFTSYQGKQAGRIALLNQQGIADTVFLNNSGTGASGKIWSVSAQADGKILIAGDFTSYNGVPRNRIARLYGCLTEQPDSIYGNSYALCSGTPQTYTLTPVSGATKYEWTLPNGWIGSSDSTSITAISNGMGGTISVRAFTDSCGWSYKTLRTIATIQPPSVNICLVTVDDQSTHNIVIWEKPQTTTIDSFFIYRETSANIYTKVGAVGYNDLSEFHDDTTANPNTTNYRYKLSVLDTCGAESALSPYHSTIHLQNLGSGNFQWTFYNIESQPNPVNNFNFYRDAFNNGNFFQTGNIPGTNSTYSDITYSNFPNANYVVDVNWNISCSPTRQVNTTRSNKRPQSMGVIIDTSTLINDMLDNKLHTFPNPASGWLQVNSHVPISQYPFLLYTTLGQPITLQKEVINDYTVVLQLPRHLQGICTLVVQNSNGWMRTKVFLE